MLCRPITEKVISWHFCNFDLPCGSPVFWPSNLELFFNMVLEYGTFDFEGDFLIHVFDHLMTLFSRYYLIFCLFEHSFTHLEHFR